MFVKKSSARVGRSTTERATTIAMKKAIKAAHLSREEECVSRRGHYQHGSGFPRRTGLDRLERQA